MPHKEKKFISPWIAWSLVVLAVAMTGFAVWACWFQIDTIAGNIGTNGIKPVKAPSTTTATTATADWKTYTNDTYAFSFKYPKDWTVDTSNLNIVTLDSPENQKVEEDIKAGKVYGEGHMRDIYIKYYPKISDTPNKLTSLNNWLNDNAEFTQGATKITFAGQTAYEGIAGGFDAYYHIVIPYNDHYYEILFGNAENKIKLTNTGKNIISTFQFTK